MKTKVIYETISSEHDINGNSYHVARFYNPMKGRQDSVGMEIGGKSNAAHIAYALAGNDWEATLGFESTVPKREFMRIRKLRDFHLYEGSPEALAALAKLFSGRRK